MSFSVKCLFPDIRNGVAGITHHVYPITGLSLLATKASQSPHFQPKPTMWELLEEVDLRHRSHRSGTSSTNFYIWFPSSPLVSSKELVEVDLRHRSHRSGTSSTNLMPICLHLDCSSSPLVSTKELREWDLHTTKFRRTH